MKKSRRKFIIYASTIFLSQPLFAGYAKKINILKEPYQSAFILYKDLFEIKKGIIYELHALFFEEIHPPKVVELNSIAYFAGVLADERIMKSSREYLVKGFTWLDETAIELYTKKYIHLQYSQRQKVLEHINALEWGDDWLYRIMSYYFESMLCSPVYGANINKVGWKWLEYEPGFPQPKKV